MDVLPFHPSSDFRNRVELHRAVVHGVDGLGQPVITYQKVCNLWVSIEPQGSGRFMSSEYVQAEQNRGRNVHILRGNFKSDLDSLSRFVHGFRIFNISQIARTRDNRMFFFEALCFENSLPPPVISHGLSWICHTDTEPLIYA